MERSVRNDLGSIDIMKVLIAPEFTVPSRLPQVVAGNIRPFALDPRQHNPFDRRRDLFFTPSPVARTVPEPS